VRYINVLQQNFPAGTEKNHASSHNSSSKHIMRPGTSWIQTRAATTIISTAVYRKLAFDQFVLPVAYSKQFKTSSERDEKLNFVIFIQLTVLVLRTYCAQLKS
jgi:hypothetical protein